MAEQNPQCTHLRKIDSASTPSLLDWMNSEYSMFRLQLARDTSLGPGLVNNQVFLQYVMSIGPHGAHRF